MIDEAALPEPAARLAQADAIADTLRAGDYVMIGLDHFAHRGDTLALAQRAGNLHRNFQGYTDDPAPVLLGVGASAIGELPQGYVQNITDIRHWHADLSDGLLPVARGIALKDDDRLRRAIIERLMCDLAVDLDVMAGAYGLPVPHADLLELETLGVVSRTGSRIEIAEAFRPLTRVVAAAFDSRLAAAGARHAIAV
jgi:oxygen-independent coproporphyrinogen-3 oxidase